MPLVMKIRQAWRRDGEARRRGMKVIVRMCVPVTLVSQDERQASRVVRLTKAAPGCGQFCG